MNSSLEAKLDYHFRNPALLELALTHASWGHQQKKRLPHNERLEFLGDSVLSLAISEQLYNLFPDIAEGRLTKIRAHLVNRSSMVAMAKEMGLGDYLIMSKAESSQGGRERVSNLANAMEAIIAAIYLDGGFDAARKFVVTRLEPRLLTITDNPEPENAKGSLQEKLHAMGKEAAYRIISEEGPPHSRRFEAVVELAGEVIGKGGGATKKIAEMEAAAQALKWIEG